MFILFILHNIMACAAMDMDYGYGLDYDPNNEDLLALFSNDEQPGIDFLQNDNQPISTNSDYLPQNYTQTIYNNIILPRNSTQGSNSSCSSGSGTPKTPKTPVSGGTGSGSSGSKASGTPKTPMSRLRISSTHTSGSSPETVVNAFGSEMHSPSVPSGSGPNTPPSIYLDHSSGLIGMPVTRRTLFAGPTGSNTHLSSGTHLGTETNATEAHIAEMQALKASMINVYGEGSAGFETQTPELNVSGTHLAGQHESLEIQEPTRSGMQVSGISSPKASVKQTALGVRKLTPGKYTLGPSGTPALTHLYRHKPAIESGNGTRLLKSSGNGTRLLKSSGNGSPRKSALGTHINGSLLVESLNHTTSRAGKQNLKQTEAGKQPLIQSETLTHQHRDSGTGKQPLIQIEIMKQTGKQPLVELGNGMLPFFQSGNGTQLAELSGNIPQAHEIVMAAYETYGMDPSGMPMISPGMNLSEASGNLPTGTYLSDQHGSGSSGSNVQDIPAPFRAIPNISALIRRVDAVLNDFKSHRREIWNRAEKIVGELQKMHENHSHHSSDQNDLSSQEFEQSRDMVILVASTIETAILAIKISLMPMMFVKPNFNPWFDADTGFMLPPDSKMDMALCQQIYNKTANELVHKRGPTMNTVLWSYLTMVEWRLGIDQQDGNYERTVDNFKGIAESLMGIRPALGIHMRLSNLDLYIKFYTIIDEMLKSCGSENLMVLNTRKLPLLVQKLRFFLNQILSEFLNFAHNTSIV